MKKLAIVFFIAIGAMAVPLVMQYQTIQQLRRDNDTLKLQVAQIAPLQEQVTRAAQEAADAGNADTQLHELARLRAQVQQLRTATNALSKAQQQIQTLQQRIESDAAVRQEQAAAVAASAQTDARRTAEMGAVHRMNACINNLRLLDAAKQQWALENRKGAADTPTMDDLRPYVGHGPNAELPVCPDGGVYTLGTVAEKPTCSIQGHVLP